MQIRAWRRRLDDVLTKLIYMPVLCWGHHPARCDFSSYSRSDLDSAVYVMWWPPATHAYWHEFQLHGMENSTPYSQWSHQVFSQPLITAMLGMRIWDISPKLWDKCFQGQHSRLLFMAAALMLLGQTLSLFLETDYHLMPSPVLSTVRRDNSLKRIHFWMHDTLFKHTYIQWQEGKWCWIQPGGCMHWWDRQTGVTGWDEMCMENRKNRERELQFPSPHGRIFKPGKHKKQSMEERLPRSGRGVLQEWDRTPVLSCTMIRSYCEVSCWRCK